MNDEIKLIQATLRAVKKEMRERGIKRKSCFNGGLSSEEYYYNAKMFRLETELEEAKRKELAAPSKTFGGGNYL